MKLANVVDQVAYTGLFLLGQTLKQFEPYLAEFETNGLTLLNKEVKYIFLLWEGFSLRLM